VTECETLWHTQTFMESWAGPHRNEKDFEDLMPPH